MLPLIFQKSTCKIDTNALMTDRRTVCVISPELNQRFRSSVDTRQAALGNYLKVVREVARLVFVHICTQVLMFYITFSQVQITITPFTPCLIIPLIRFSPSTLEWIGYYDPKLDSTMSTAHWAPEPNTNNMLNYHIKVDM